MKFSRRLSPDIKAVLILLALWLLFFWRIFTPNSADQVSIIQGDFSRQFYTFSAYQYERFADGEIPLWNPYNNGGFPFIADTQAAVFYPPRLLNILIHRFSGGWDYNALQLEMTLHILAYTLMMYTFVRLMTIGNGNRSIYAGFTSATIAGYGGFMSGYPPVQLALLEAGIWLPLALIGIYKATQTSKIQWVWLGLSGFALGLSWMAGHPQTSWFSTYLLVAYLGYRASLQKHSGWTFINATILTGIITFGVTAVTLLPGAEYLAHTMRLGFGFEAKAGGFPLQDVIQFMIPSVVSFYSPLFIGITGLILAVIGAVSTSKERLFWGVCALIALGMSFGANTPVFHALYNLLPGLSYFRGQERAAYIVSNCLAILAGLGVVSLHNGLSSIRLHLIQRVIFGFIIGGGVLSGAVFILWIGNPDAYALIISPVLFSTVIAAIFLFLTTLSSTSHRLLWLTGLVLFELFTVNMDNQNYAAIPAAEQPIQNIPSLVWQAQQDTATPFRVDGSQINGEIGIYGGGNTGSLYQLQDIRGISPLFLDGPHAIIQREAPVEIAWEIFAVRYVFTDAEALNVDSEIIGRDYPAGKTLNLHQLSDPRPFALLVYDYEVINSDAFARALLADSNFDARETVILDKDPEITLPLQPPLAKQADLIDYAPEHFTIGVVTPENALLSVSQVDYPGWEVTLDGVHVKPIRAYGAVTALPIPAGEHIVRFIYNPLTFRIGAVLSLLTWGSLTILAVILLLRRW